MALQTEPITIGNSVWVASRAIILPGTKLGDGCVVAAGAVISKNVQEWTVVGGNPAKELKKRVLK